MHLSPPVVQGVVVDVAEHRSRPDPPLGPRVVVDELGQPAHHL